MRDSERGRTDLADVVVRGAVGSREDTAAARDGATKLSSRLPHHLSEVAAHPVSKTHKEGEGEGTPVVGRRRRVVHRLIRPHLNPLRNRVRPRHSLPPISSLPHPTRKDSPPNSLPKVPPRPVNAETRICSPTSAPQQRASCSTREGWHRAPPGTSCAPRGRVAGRSRRSGRRRG